ncbi:MAG: penicillin-binding protein 2 [Demequinaceae bacterium]|nr:penicillin-binding protein 2 [Demequinaceae bacterium]
MQILSAAPLAEEALAQRLVTVDVTPARADIVDRNGVVLATSVERYNLTVNQVTLAKWQRKEGVQVTASGPLDAAKILAPILGVSESELGASLAGDKKFAYVAKNLTPEVLDLVKAERIAGIGSESTPLRLYPNGATAGNIIGFMAGSADSTLPVGSGGIEQAFQDQLEGVAGSRTYERSKYGTTIPAGIHSEEAAVPGQAVVLTMDRDIQYFAEQRLAQAVSETGSSGGAVVVTDPLTGEVLAMADYGAVDPSNASATDASHRGSGAVEDVFEPGSTAKIITMAAALEEGVATPTSQYVAPYEYTTANNQTFHDSHAHEDEKLTLTGVLVKSSNTGTVMIGEQMSDETRYHYMTAFGLGERTGIGLVSESPGILKPWNKWDGRTKYATSFGQGVSVTALQTAQVYGTVANGGVRVAPTIVKGLNNADGTFTPTASSTPVRVVSENTASELMSMLTEVTEDGTGKAAQIDGYLVAGKTGTAQAPDADGKMTRIVASFVGIAPADSPRVVVSVILYDPKSSIWGGDVAAPVFKDVATFALQTLRVPPSTGTLTQYPTTWE